MEISWGQGLNWLNCEFKDLVGINGEVEGQICNLLKRSLAMCLNVHFL